MYDTITNYNDLNHTPLFNANIREAINKLILVEQAEANNVTVDRLITHKNESGYLVNKVVNFKISNEVRNNMIDKFANMTINDVGNNLNGANAIDVQVQFAGDPIGNSHQNLLSSRKIGIRHKEVPLLDPPT